MTWKNPAWGNVRGPDAGAQRRTASALTTYLNGPSQYLHVPFLVGPYAWMGMPAAVTEHPGILRCMVDLSPYAYFQLSCSIGGTAGYAGSEFLLKYTTDLDGSSGWTELDSSARCVIDVGANTFSYGERGAVPTEARTVVLLSLFGAGGNGVVNPTPSNTFAVFRPAEGDN